MKLTQAQLVRLGRIVVYWTEDTGGCLLCCVASDGVHDATCPLGKMLKVPRKPRARRRASEAHENLEGLVCGRA